MPGILKAGLVFLQNQQKKRGMGGKNANKIIYALPDRFSAFWLAERSRQAQEAD